MASVTSVIQQSWATINNEDIFKRGKAVYGVHDDRFIVVGGGIARENGTIDVRPMISVVMFDISTQTYLSLPDLPFPGTEQSVILNGYLYIRSMNEIYRMCLSSRSEWEHLAHDDQSFGFNIISNGKYIFIIYMHGGMVRYDPEDNEFMQLAQIPTTRLDHVSVLLENKIYIIGGRTHGGQTHCSTVEVFDIDTQAWSEAPPLPKEIAQASATVFKKWIIINGGLTTHTGSGYNDETFMFDTCAQKWIQSDQMLSPPRRLHRCVIVGSQLISIGGVDEWSEYCPMEAIHIKYLIPNWKWEIIKDFVLLRQLVDAGRAHPIIIISDESKKIDQVMQKMITETVLDVFRTVLSFLI